MNSSNFEFLYIIGRGGFGKVWQVVMKKNNKNGLKKHNDKNMNINNGVELYKKRTNKSEIYEEKTKDNNYFNEYINIIN